MLLFPIGAADRSATLLCGLARGRGSRHIGLAVRCREANNTWRHVTDAAIVHPTGTPGSGSICTAGRGWGSPSPKARRRRGRGRGRGRGREQGRGRGRGRTGIATQSGHDLRPPPTEQLTPREWENHQQDLCIFW